MTHWPWREDLQCGGPSCKVSCCCIHINEIQGFLKSTVLSPLEEVAKLDIDRREKWGWGHCSLWDHTICVVSQLHLVMARLCSARQKPRHAACAYLLWFCGEGGKERSPSRRWLRFVLKDRGAEKKVVLLLNSVSTSLLITVETTEVQLPWIRAFSNSPK